MSIFNGFDFDDEELDEEEISEILNGIRYIDETEYVYHEKYKRLNGGELIDRYEESHENPKVWHKLKKYFVEAHKAPKDFSHSDFISKIATAKNENELQLYFKQYPFILTTSVSPAHHGQICIPKPKLGNQLEPDFLIAGLDSAGFWWYGVELENPNYKMFTKTGEETKELKHAIRQIQEWRAWLKQNISYAQNTLGFTHIDADLPCFIFIGRRENEVLSNEVLTERRQQLRASDKHGLFIYHYEWLIDKPHSYFRVKD